MIFVEHAGKRTFVIVFVLPNEKLIVILPIFFEYLFEEVVIVERFELLRNSIFFAFIKSNIIQIGEDAAEGISFFADNKAEGKSPKEAVSISSHLPVSIQSWIQVPLEVLLDGWTEGVEFFLHVHGVRDGPNGILDGFKFFVRLFQLLASNDLGLAKEILVHKHLL